MAVLALNEARIGASSEKTSLPPIHSTSPCYEGGIILILKIINYNKHFILKLCCIYVITRDIVATVFSEKPWQTKRNITPGPLTAVFREPGVR